MCIIFCCCLVAKLYWTLVTPWTVTYQAPLSMGFPRQEYWSGLPFPSRGDLPNPEMEPCLLHWQVASLPLSHSRSPRISNIIWCLSFLVCLTFLGIIISRSNIATNGIISFFISSVQSLSRVWLFLTPWTAARQASLSITNSRSLPELMSIELVMPSNHLILCRPLLLLPYIWVIFHYSFLSTWCIITSCLSIICWWAVKLFPCLEYCK